MLSTISRRTLGIESRSLTRSNEGPLRAMATKAVQPSSSLSSANSRARLPMCSSRASFAPRAHFFTTSSRRQEQEEQAEEKKEMDDGEKNIHDILTKNFQPAHLEVQDVSGGCGSFYAIVIASSEFNGKPTVKAHRLVNEALKDVISGIHGLQLRTMPVKN